MWNTPHSKTGWNLGTEDESTEYFTLNGVTCYYDCKFRFIGSQIPLATDQCFRL